MNGLLFFVILRGANSVDLPPAALDIRLPTNDFVQLNENGKEERASSADFPTAFDIRIATKDVLKLHETGKEGRQSTTGTSTAGWYEERIADLYRPVLGHMDEKYSTVRIMGV